MRRHGAGGPTIIVGEDAQARRVRGLLRRSMVTSLGGSLGLVGVLGAGGLLAHERSLGHDPSFEILALLVLGVGVSLAAGVSSVRDNREALDVALRARRPGMLRATEPEPFLADRRR